MRVEYEGQVSSVKELEAKLAKPPTVEEMRALLADVLSGIDVCHQCGDVLVPDEYSIGTRCEAHESSIDDVEDGEPWHIPAEEWKRRLAKAKAALGTP